MSFSENYTPMEDTFAGKSCLVTGASGFLGKVLVEKLIYSLADIDTVYVIIRPQKGNDAKKRLSTLLESPIFDRIRSECPSRLAKIVPIAGDLMESDMALSPADVHRLCDNVSFIFHSAATVKFDEKLKISMNMNVHGTQRLVALAHKMSKLQAFVHTSTAYANCDRTRVNEAVYPPSVDPHKLIDALSWMSEPMIEALSPMVVGDRPNTYTLTKSLAEHLIQEECGDKIPVTIVRPSIIGATCAEPLVGWVDNLNGPTGIFAAVGKGLLTNMPGDASAKADIIPVDICANVLICAAWHRATNKFDKVPVINCCTGRLNPIWWHQIINYLYRFYTHVPLEGALSYPTTKFHLSRAMYDFQVNMKHIIPAYFMDLGSRLMGQKPRMIRLYSKLSAAVEVLSFFTSKEWDFQSKGMLNIHEDMSEEDRRTFNIDVRQLNWDHYLHDYLLGVKRYVLKDNMECTKGALTHISRLRAFTTMANILCTALAVKYLSPKTWKPQRKWTVFAVASAIQSYLLLRRQQPLVGVQPRLELYGQPFGPRTCRVLTSTQSERNLKSLDKRN